MRFLVFALAFAAASTTAGAQGRQGIDGTLLAEAHQQPVGDAGPPASTAGSVVRRWLDLQNASLNLRYRFVDTSAGVTAANQLQHRETLRGRLKFDAPGRYALAFGVSTGVRFTSSWDNTGLGMGSAQKNLAVRALYVSAEPLTGVVGEVGGLYIVKGESTEITAYDDDGYIMGERITLRRPQELFFDEISFANAYFVGGTGAEEISVGKRFRHIDEPNYRHVLVGKQVGGRGAVSADFTLESGRRTWRQAVTLEIPEVRVVDSIVFEQYERTNADPAFGFAVTFAKQLTSRFSLNQFGYARIDSEYGGLNADRFHIGNRAFVMATYEISPELTASFFITTAVGGNDALPQRTLSNTAVTYNALPALKRTGWF